MKSILLTIIFLFTIISIHGQNKTQIGQKEILVYDAVIKTSKGKIKGILQRTDSNQLVITKNNQSIVIPIENIKTLKIKFSKKKTVPVFNNIAQTAIDFISDPQLSSTVNSYSINSNGKQVPLDVKETPLGERLLVGGAIMTTAIVGNELGKLIPPATLETFKIEGSMDKYKKLYDELSMYSIDMQASPDYEFKLRKKLKEAMEKNKLKI